MSLAKLSQVLVYDKMDQKEQELIAAHKRELRDQKLVEKRGKMIQWRKHWARRRFHGVG